MTIQATDYGAGAGNVGTMIDHLTVLGGEAKTFAHDSNGNCATNGNAVYYWDSEDRLVAIVNGNVRTDITYDGLGRCVKMVETTNGVSLPKRFIWSGTELLMERDGLDVLQNGGTAAFKYFYPEGVFVGHMTRGGDQVDIEIASYFYAKDRLGNVREMTDSAGNIRARYDYDPYGRRTKVQGDLDADFGFTGLFFHAPSGLNLAVFRAYDADIGRWMSRDPIMELGGLNLFAYTRNNPVSRRDRSGLWDDWDDLDAYYAHQDEIRQLVDWNTYDGYYDEANQRLHKTLALIPNDLFAFGGVGGGPGAGLKGEALCLVGVGGKFSQPYAGVVGAGGLGPVSTGYEWNSSDGLESISFLDANFLLGGFGRWSTPKGYGIYMYVGPVGFAGTGLGWSR